jgi:hypothetical protein
MKLMMINTQKINGNVRYFLTVGKLLSKRNSSGLIFFFGSFNNVISKKLVSISGHSGRWGEITGHGNRHQTKVSETAIF